jgi:hypothetical protein
VPSARRATNHGRAFGVGVGVGVGVDDTFSATALVLDVDVGDVGATLVVCVAPVVTDDAALDEALAEADVAAGEAEVPTAPRVGAGTLADVGDPPQARSENTGTTDTSSVIRRPVERGDVVMLV